MVCGQDMYADGTCGAQVDGGVVESSARVLQFCKPERSQFLIDPRSARASARDIPRGKPVPIRSQDLATLGGHHVQAHCLRFPIILIYAQPTIESTSVALPQCLNFLSVTRWPRTSDLFPPTVFSLLCIVRFGANGMSG